MPLIVRIALSLAIVGLGAGVLYIGVGGLGTVAGASARRSTGSSTTSRPPPRPIPSVAVVSGAPSLESADEPYTNAPQVDLVVTVPASMVGNPTHRIRVYLALQGPDAGADPGGADRPTARRPHPGRAHQGHQRLHRHDRGRRTASPSRRRSCATSSTTAKPKVTITSPKANAVVNGKSVDHQGQDAGPLDAARPQRRPTAPRSRGPPRRTARSRLSIPIAPARTRSTIDGDRPGRERQQRVALTVRRGNGKLTASLSASALPGRPRKALPEGIRLTARRPIPTATARGRGRDVHPQHPGIQTITEDADDRFERACGVADHDPQGRDRGQGSATVLVSSDCVRVHAGLHRHHRHQVAAAGPARPRSTARRVAATIRGMPMWRCPHCGTPQAETARCWVCRRSSTACLTCRHFRRSVAGEHGLLRARPSSAPLRGDEIRGMLGRRALLDGADDPRGARQAAPSSTARPIHADRVRRGRRRAARARPLPRRDRRRATTRAAVAEPVPPLAARRARWSLWEDPIARPRPRPDHAAGR